ncbi:TadE/TadG family type IV pilus assembly protein [Shimia sp. NS0008-38b]|uniref:TadE/TadG family type IV pilus assembly protein n=1 Tax=Shimia sp. NS0008-38b TaxID=3127653 RepID=UPI0033418013
MTKFSAENRRIRSARLPARLQAGASCFRKDEDGVMVGFAVVLVIMMIMIGGLGTDIMLAEMKRTRLQHTLDRAVLAAADMDQDRAAEVVVADYFDKSGVEYDSVSATESSSVVHRRVSATAEVDFTLRHSQTGARFRNLWRKHEEPREIISSFTVGAAGTAEERIGNVEISLVLDVSGSMNSNSRLYNLKNAATDFIDTMDDNTEDGTLSVSIVPYATQVSAPNALFEHLAVTSEHSYSNCVDFDVTDFSSTGIDPTVSLKRTGHFDPWGDRDNRDDDPAYPLGGYQTSQLGDPVCEIHASREMAVLEDDPEELKNYIAAMWGGGNTSIDLGMKWGTALLDPDIRPAIEGMIEDTTVSENFAGRPFDHNSGESLKVIVLMTDGQNTSQYYIRDAFKSGASNVWWNEQEEVYSVYLGSDVNDLDEDDVTDEPIFYWPPYTGSSNVDIIEGYYDHAYGNGVYEEEETDWELECKSYYWNGSCRRYRWVEVVIGSITVDEPGVAEVIDYPDLWAYTTPRWVADELYAPFMGQSSARSYWDDGVQGYYGTSTKNSRSSSICDAAKDQGIIVFTIGFEAPSSGQTVLKDCASSDSHYFDVDGLEINDAFATIATSIRQLRLTQ